MRTVQVPIQVRMDQLQPWMQMEEEATLALMVQLPLGMQMVVDPILILMAPLVLILPMDQVLTPMLMGIHTAWMLMAIVPLQELMDHPAP